MSAPASGKFPERSAQVRTVLFFLAWWLGGVVLALSFGLGWFFATQAAQRVLMCVPPIYIPLLRLLVGPARAEAERAQLERSSVRAFYMWRALVALVWVVLTLVVFRVANINLSDAFR